MQTKHVDNVVPLAMSPAAPLPAKADVVILGGGIMGTSIAFHLAEAGVRNIVLIERNSLGSGSSAKSDSSISIADDKSPGRINFNLIFPSRK